MSLFLKMLFSFSFRNAELEEMSGSWQLLSLVTKVVDGENMLSGTTVGSYV